MNMNGQSTRARIVKILAILPIVFISLNKISVNYNYDKRGHWHRVINEPVERLLTPVLGEQHFINRNYHETPEYQLSAFFWVLMLYLVAFVSQLGMALKSTGIVHSFTMANTIIIGWFTIEFLLTYNMISSIPKIVAWCIMVIILIIKGD